MTTRWWTCLCMLWLGLAISSCDPAPQEPLIRLHLFPADPTAIQAVLTISATDPTGQTQQRIFDITDGPGFELFGVTFPMGTRGASTYQIDLYRDASCKVATGGASLNLDSDSVFDVNIPMTAVPLCGLGATLTVQLSKINGGSGRIVSMPAGIDCQDLGAGCSLIVKKGTQVLLTAQPQGGTSFAGWSGSTCTGTGTCALTVTEDTVVQGIFTTCRGWCREQLPTSVTANLNGVAGTASNNVYVVGEAGTVLHFDGTTWKSVAPPPASANVTFRAVAIRATPGVLNVAGDSGTILTRTGTTWTTVTNTIITGAIRGIAIGGDPSAPDTHFIGDSMSGLVLTHGGSSVLAKSVGGPGTLYGIVQVPGTTGDDLLLGGAMSAGKGYAVRWDGNTLTTLQMASGPNLPGDIYAMACTPSYFYAAGAGGVIVRRSNALSNDNNWTRMTTPTTNTLRAMVAIAEGFIIAVGDGGIILQYDGTTWTSLVSPTTSSLRGVWGSSPINIYAVGDGGVVLHYLP